MVVVDNAEKIRDRAYHLWESAGRPNGREHEFWAQAAREIEIENESDASLERTSRSVAR